MMKSLDKLIARLDLELEDLHQASPYRHSIAYLYEDDLSAILYYLKDYRRLHGNVYTDGTNWLYDEPISI